MLGISVDDLSKVSNWLGCTQVVLDEKGLQVSYKEYLGLFNPHEETGRHWLVEMMKKLNRDQWREFEELITEEGRELNISNPIMQWVSCAPSELCFEKIMEVIE